MGTRNTTKCHIFILWLVVILQTLLLITTVINCNFFFNKEETLKTTTTKTRVTTKTTTTKKTTTTASTKKTETKIMKKVQLQPARVVQKKSDMFLPRLEYGVEDIDYRFLGKEKVYLGEGTYGTVYRTTYRGVQVAIKICEDVPIFKKEVEILQKLGNWHPALPKLVAVHWKKPYTLMTVFHQFKDGESRTLSGLITKRNELKSWELLALFLDIIGAVQHLNTVGILHSDIKAKNILVEKRGDRYAGVLIDFTNSLPTVHNAFYKLNHTERARWREIHRSMAPEVIDGGLRTLASEVYSLGRQIYRVALQTPELEELLPLSQLCMEKVPDKRPSLGFIVNRLARLKRRLEAQKNKSGVHS